MFNKNISQRDLSFDKTVVPLFAVLICTICIHLAQFGWHHAPEATICMVSNAIYDPAMSILLGLQNVGSTRATIQPSCSDSWQLWIICVNVLNGHWAGSEQQVLWQTVSWYFTFSFASVYHNVCPSGCHSVWAGAGACPLIILISIALSRLQPYTLSPGSADYS